MGVGTSAYLGFEVYVCIYMHVARRRPVSRACSDSECCIDLGKTMHLLLSLHLNGHTPSCGIHTTLFQLADIQPETLTPPQDGQSATQNPAPGYLRPVW